jgi:hypothetical protein
MHTTANLEFGTRPVPRRGLHCTPEQARELLEGLCTAYQSLLPAERIVIRDIIGRWDATPQSSSAHVRPVSEVVRSHS